MADWHQVCKKNEVPQGQIKVFEVNGQRIALCRVKEEEFYAVQDLCTHDEGPLGEGELLDHAIECPRHGARFDVRTGKVLVLPAVVPIQSYPVKIEGEMVKVSFS